MENFFVRSKENCTTSITYPHNKAYEYESWIEIIDFDKECDADLMSGNGFIVAPSGRNIKRDLKNEDGIFSPRFGQTLADVNLFIDRYKCNCTEGGLRGRLNNGLRCPKCGKLCKFVDDNFGYFGWMKLDKYVIIHPVYYKKLESFFGKGIPIQGQKRSKIENMINLTDVQNTPLSGKNMDSKEKEEPFFGIGLIDFYNRFDEIMDFYYNLYVVKKKSNKALYYEDIMSHKDSIFTHSIPVFTTLLRPFDINDGAMSYEPTNAIYTMMNKLVTMINKNKTKIQREPKIKNQQLWNLQKKFMELYAEQEAILSGKKGDFRCLLGGRYNFTSRSVIVQNPDLRIDEITLPVIALTVMLEQRIKNILQRIYGMPPTEAHELWYKATITPNPKINTIIQSIIDECKNSGMKGLCVIINRNPSIAYGSILQMFCVGFTETYTMAVPLQILKLLAADFDGDVLNILLPINKKFMQLSWEKFNPRNCFYVSRNDGYFNPDVSMQRDTLINANTLARLGRDTYTQDDINNFERLIAKKKQLLIDMVG